MELISTTARLRAELEESRAMPPPPARVVAPTKMNLQVHGHQMQIESLEKRHEEEMEELTDELVRVTDEFTKQIEKEVALRTHALTTTHIANEKYIAELARRFELETQLADVRRALAMPADVSSEQQQQQQSAPPPPAQLDEAHQSILLNKAECVVEITQRELAVAKAQLAEIRDAKKDDAKRAAEHVSAVMEAANAGDDDETETPAAPEPIPLRQSQPDWYSR